MWITLTRGYRAEIDDVDSDLSAYRWCSSRDTVSSAGDKIYASRRTNRKIVWMHRIILTRSLGRELARGEECDHIDGDTLNNKRSNLRPATHQQNIRNQRSHSGKAKGVYFEKSTGRWKAQIMISGKNYNLGRYDTIEEASAVYDATAKQYFGEFARTNDSSDCAIVLPDLIRPRQPSASGFVGVYKSRSGNWQAQVSVKGKCVSIGTFKTPGEAKRARDDWLKENAKVYQVDV